MSNASASAVKLETASNTQTQYPNQSVFRRINHVALAVRDLEKSIEIFQNILGFELKKRREKNGMLAADMECNGMYFVLCQGMNPDSEFSRFVDQFGVGVNHIALDVDDVDSAVQTLSERGMVFDTPVIRETGVVHAFTARSEDTGLAIEVIRCGS